MNEKASAAWWLVAGTFVLAPALFGQTAAPLTEQDAVNRAIAASPQLRDMRAAVAEAAANQILAEQAFRPTASFSTTPGYASGLPVAVLGQVPAIGTIEAHQVFYDLSSKADVFASRAQVDAAKAELDARTRETARSVSEMIARYAADQALVDAAQRQAAAESVLVEHLQALLKEGRVRALDAARTALQLTTAQRGVELARTTRDLDELRLRRAIGWPAEQPLAVRPEPVPTTAAIASDDLELAEKNDPVLQSLRARLVQLDRATALERNPFRPTVAAQVQYSRLFARYGQFYLNFKPDDFSVAATINLPLFTGGRRAAVVSRLAAQRERVAAQLQQRKNELEIGVRQAEGGLKDAIAESELAGRSHELALESLRVGEATAKEGRGEANDVAIAQAALAEADRQVAQAEMQVRIARAQLAVLRGELPEPQR